MRILVKLNCYVKVWSDLLAEAHAIQADEKELVYTNSAPSDHKKEQEILNKKEKEILNKKNPLRTAVKDILSCPRRL